MKLLKILFFGAILTLSSSYANSKIKLYFVHKIGCPACAQTAKNMKRADIASLIAKNFDLIKIESSQKDRLPKIWMYAYRYPTLIFADKHNQKIIDSIHNLSADQLKATLLKAIKTYKEKRPQ